MADDLIISGGNIVTGAEIFTGTIVVRDGRVVALGRGDTLRGPAEEVIDARGMTVMPGAIDAHTHFEEPGPSSYRENFSTGSRSCAAGGVTTTLEHPLSRPPVRDRETFQAKLAVANEKSVIDFGLWGGLIPGYIGCIEDMVQLGAVAFKAFMSEAGADYPMTEDGELLAGMYEATRVGALVGLHAESEALTKYFTGAVREAGRTDYRAVSEGRPPVAELEAINRAIFLAEQVGARIHIVHMSIPAGATLIAGAKARGVDVSCETCAHYLHFDWTALDRLGAYAKCKPPVRSPEQVAALWQSVLEGQVDFIASDHAPYTREEKEHGDMWDAPWGIPGAQTMLPLLISDGLLQRGMEPNAFVRFTSTRAAQRFGIYPQKGTIMVGSDADLVILDLAGTWTVRESDLFSKHGFSPYAGETLHGRIERTIVRGRTVYYKGEITAEDGYGEFVRPRARGRSDDGVRSL